MDKIEISNANVSNIVQELTNEKTRISGYIENLKTQCDYINQAWKGADATAYMSKMNDDYTVLITDFVKCLDSYISYLSQVFSEYQKIDETYASQTIEV